MKLEISLKEISDIKEGFAKWVQEFEQYVSHQLIERPLLNAHTGYITNMISTAFLFVHSRYMPFFILQMTYNELVPCGVIGPSQWSDIAVSLLTHPKANGHHMSASVVASATLLNST
jgi:hypothetical protein